MAFKPFESIRNAFRPPDVGPSSPIKYPPQRQELPEKPPKFVFTELPNVESLDTNQMSQSVQFVRAILAQLSIGQFYSPAQLVDLMRRDDRISGVWDTRLNGLLGSPVDFEHSGDGRRTKLVDELKEIFPDICSTYALSQLLAWARWLGVGIGQLVWDRKENRWCPYLKVWHPRFVYWNWGERQYHVITEEGDVPVTPGDGQWVLLTPWGPVRGWMYSQIRTLSILWLMRQWAMRDWARYSEVHGLPIRKAIVPKDAADDEKQRFVSELARIGSEATVRVPQGADGDKFDVVLTEAMGKSNESFEMLLKRLDMSIAIAVLGQNLTTEVTGGSYAAANVHDRIRIDFLKSDARCLEQCVRDQILKPWASINYGDPELAPKPCWYVQTTEDKTQFAQAFMNISLGLEKLQASGMNVDLETLAEKVGIPLDADEPVHPQVDPQKKVDAEEADLDAQTENPPSAPKPPEPPAGGQGKPASKNLSAREATPAIVEGQTYVDAVADSGRDLARKALRPDTVKLLAAIDAATDFESLKKVLVRIYGEMRPKKLAALVERARVLAELTGRSVVKADLE